MRTAGGKRSPHWRPPLSSWVIKPHPEICRHRDNRWIWFLRARRTRLKSQCQMKSSTSWMKRCGKAFVNATVSTKERTMTTTITTNELQEYRAVLRRDYSAFVERSFYELNPDR